MNSLFNRDQVTVYKQDNNVDDSLIAACKNAVLTIKIYKWLIWVEFKKNFFSPYTQSGIGKLWAFILPLIPISVYLLLGYLRVLNIGDDMPYPVFIISGMTFWFLIREGIQTTMRSIQRNAHILSKLKMPFLVIILSNLGSVIANFMIRLSFLILIMILFNFYPGFRILFLPIIIFPVILFCCGLGVILSILNTTNNDVGNFADIFLSYGLFVSSVIFSMPTSGVIGTINKLNIFNEFIVVLRQFIVFGSLNDPLKYLLITTISIFIFLISIRYQHRMQYLIRNLL
jgi:lipopolysaccharide transport system permease protein